jgi:hypothetical protein
MLQIDSALIDHMKKDASRLMISSLFQTFLYPAMDKINNLATAALDLAITRHTNNSIHFPHLHSITHGDTQ